MGFVNWLFFRALRKPPIPGYSRAQSAFIRMGWPL